MLSNDGNSSVSKAPCDESEIFWEDDSCLRHYEFMSPAARGFSQRLSLITGINFIQTLYSHINDNVTGKLSIETQHSSILTFQKSIALNGMKGIFQG